MHQLGFQGTVDHARRFVAPVYADPRNIQRHAQQFAAFQQSGLRGGLFGNVLYDEYQAAGAAVVVHQGDRDVDPSLDDRAIGPQKALVGGE